MKRTSCKTRARIELQNSPAVDHGRGAFPKPSYTIHWSLRANRDRY